MADQNIPYGGVGAVAFEQSDLFSQVELFSGPSPAYGTFEDYPVAENSDFAAFTVVGIDGSGDIALATEDATVQAIGILTAPVITGAGETTRVTVARSGCFNPAGLVWDASYDSDAKKEAAFRAAPTPTTITIRKRL